MLRGYYAALSLKPKRYVWRKTTTYRTVIMSAELQLSLAKVMASL